MNRLIIFIWISSVLSSCQTIEEIRDGLARTSNRQSALRESIGQQSTYLRDNFGEPQNFISFSKFDLFYYKNYVFKTDSQKKIVDYAPLGNVFYNMNIDTLADPEYKSRVSSVAIVSGMATPSDGLEFKTNTEAIRLLISNSDKFKMMEPSEKFPDIILVVEYFMSDPQKETTVWSVPQYTYVPSQTYSTTYYGTSGYLGSSYTSGGYGHMQYAGSSLHSTTTTTFIRTLVITAIDGKEYGKSKKSKELWKVRMKSVGPTDQLRQFINDASISSYKFWGTQNDETAKYLVYYKNPAFDFLKE